MRRRRKQTAEGKGASALKKAKPGESSTAQAGAPQSRYPPFSTSGKINDLQKWNEECHKISDMLEKGKLLNLASQSFSAISSIMLAI
jgi:hypothetical protein